MPASAGTIIAPAVIVPNTKRATMLQLQLTERGQPPEASLPAAYHINRGNIGAGSLVKSERN
jgi:hypothetical protein